MKSLFAVIILTFFVSGCNKKERPDVKGLVQEVKIGRLDREVFTLDTLAPDVKGVYERYGRYFDTYTRGVLNLGGVADSGFVNLFRLFICDKVMREVADSVRQCYPDMEEQEKELAWAWAYYAHYFPRRVIPKIYAHISGFNQSVIVDSAAIGVSLDNYLGEQCLFYSMLSVPVPMYARKKMTSDDIVRDILSGWLQVEFPYRPLKNDLVSGMVNLGKSVYVLEKLFPERPCWWLFGFTPEQEKWCVENESQIWGFLIENDYLFTTQQRLIMKYLTDAPFTSGMPSESPGRAVVWSGYQIVARYVEKTKISLDELMAEQDYHKILRGAGYRP